MVAPSMDRGAAASGVQSFAGLDNMYVSQTRKGCIKECFGCEQNSEFNIYKGTQQQVVKGGEHMYALEQASCPCRFFCKAQRTSTMTVTGGSGAGGPAIMSYDRPFRCMPSPCKCCCFQEMTFKDETGQSIGKVKEDFTWCVPHFTTYKDDAETQPEFQIQMPTCCGGMCIDVCAEGLCNCRIPFYVYPAGELQRGSELAGSTPEPNEKKGTGGMRYAQITKVWGGMASEMFTDADKFELEFPKGIDAAAKARLLGSVFFLNMNFFEAQKDQNAG